MNFGKPFTKLHVIVKGSKSTFSDKIDKKCWQQNMVQSCLVLQAQTCCVVRELIPDLNESYNIFCRRIWAEKLMNA